MKELLNKLKDWWNNLSLREKRVVLIGAILVAVFILYAGIWMPYINYIDGMRDKINQNQKLLAWMQNADQELKKYNKQDNATKQATLNPVALLGIIQKQIDKSGLSSSLKQLKQASNETIEIHFEKVNFDKLMHLLIALSKEQTVTLDQLTTTAVGSDGLVNVDVLIRIG